MTMKQARAAVEFGKAVQHLQADWRLQHPDLPPPRFVGEMTLEELVMEWWVLQPETKG